MIYLDNAATGFPKPRSVLEDARNAILSPLGNPGRSGHALSLKSAELVYEARRNVAELIGSDKPEHVIFTSGATAACNMAILGVVAELRKRIPLPLAVTDVFEHNSVLRPLFLLEKMGLIRLKILSPYGHGLSFAELTAPPPDLLVVTGRSNVTGREFPLREIASFLKRYGTVIITDGAQALGDGEFTFDSTGADFICGAGHKGLMGIMGAGFLAVSDSAPFLPAPVFTGGSGLDSFSAEMPPTPPESLEAGTLPVPAIAAMGSGAKYLLKEGKRISEKKKEHKKHLTEGIASLKQYRLYEPEFPRGPLIVNHRSKSPEELCEILSQNGIFARAGFHCAPLAHRYLGTETSGALRLSPGPFHTPWELDRVLQVLASI